ncbi:tetratricopeptide repeat protein [Algivirga pacifica]|uniref:Tetratricopeptide repeat-containing protein n=1 Tax=Algivirga pacifica TaxID=1162670 RepID=A0ABP9DHZ2_9BACT
MNKLTIGIIFSLLLPFNILLAQDAKVLFQEIRWKQGNSQEKKKATELLWERVKYKIQQAAWEGALNDLDKLHLMDSSDHWLYAVRARVYENTYHPLEALNDYRRALVLGGDSTLMLTGMAQSALYLDRYDVALVYLTEAIEYGEKDWSLFSQRGKVYVQLMRYEAAERDFEQAVMLNPDADEVWYHRASLAVGKKEYQKALGFIANARHLSPEKMEYAIMEALILGEAGDLHWAVNSYSSLLERDPVNLVVLNNRALLYMKMNRFTKAMADIEKAIRLAPEQPDLYLSRGLIKEFQFDFEGACQDWLKASELGSKEAENYFYDDCR